MLSRAWVLHVGVLEHGQAGLSAAVWELAAISTHYLSSLHSWEKAGISVAQITPCME